MLKSLESPEKWKVYIYLPGLIVGLAKPHWLSMYNTEKSNL